MSPLVFDGKQEHKQRIQKLVFPEGIELIPKKGDI